MSAAHPWGVEISYSYLRAYLNCPWLYRLRYIENQHSPRTAPSALGVSIHAALEAYHADGGKSHDDILQAFDAHWMHEGFSSPQEQMEYYKKGQSILQTYWDAESKNENSIVCVERAFSFPLGSHQVRGIIDRVDRRPDGSYEVIDYKTHENVADEGATAEDLQLRMYALALRESLKLEPAWLSFYYVALGRKVSVPYDSSKEKELEELITRVADALSAQTETVPNTSFCPRCDFRTRCTKAMLGIRGAQRP